MSNSTTEVKKQIVQEEITRYENTIYLWSIRIRVAKKIEDKALESNAMTELEKCEKSLDVLNEELKALG
jgi:hypothetical protein